MDEIHNILKKYDEEYVSGKLKTLDTLIPFAGNFYKDVAEIYDCITREKNIDRNPTGFSLNDAPILGLLVRIWKLLKEIIHYIDKIVDFGIFGSIILIKLLFLKGDDLW